MRLGVRRPEALVDLKRVPELSGVEIIESGGASALAVGALTSHRQLAGHGDALGLVPLLAEVVSHVGNVRVRSTGTVGGNLAFAEPRSDLATVCVALDATVEIAGPDRRRTSTVDELIVGPYETTLEPDELLVRLIVPAQPRHSARYWKLQPMERPTLGVAIVAHGEQATVVVGAATERPVRATLPVGTAAAPAIDDILRRARPDRRPHRLGRLQAGRPPSPSADANFAGSWRREHGGDPLHRQRADRRHPGAGEGHGGRGPP